MSPAPKGDGTNHPQHETGAGGLLVLGGVVVLVVATLRRLWEHHAASSRGAAVPSKRSLELTRGDTPAHIIEHIARLGDPDYICLAIAENKLTVGPLLEKLDELAAKTPRKSEKQQQSRPATISSSSSMALNMAGDSTDIDSAEESTTTSTRTSGGGTDPIPSSTLSVRSASRLASMGYGEVRGPRWVRQAVADMMGERMFHREDDVDPDNVVIAAGATSVLRLLVIALTERGQGCLIPGPYFPGFDKVLNVAGVRAWVVNRDPGAEGIGGGARGAGGLEGGVDEGISPRVLQSSLRRARAAGVEIRALLITSPHNPTGRLYSPKALLAAVAWGRLRGFHIIADEVYANCVHRPNALFRSVGSLLNGDGGGGERTGMGRDVHILYGLSKDLGVAGWRVGVLYSENKEVVAMVSKMAHTSQASSDTMDMVGHLCRATGFLDDYFKRHQEGLRAAYMSMVNQLGQRGIMYLQAEAGLFVMLDLREFLESSSKEAEEKLWRQMLERTKVNLTPGGAFHCVEPGWFRLCFAYQQVDVVSRAVDRIADFLEALVKERVAAVELDQLRRQQQQQQQHQQWRRQPQLLKAASSAAAAALSFASAVIRRATRPAAGAAEAKNRESATARRSTSMSSWVDGPPQARRRVRSSISGGDSSGIAAREGFRSRENKASGAGARASEGEHEGGRGGGAVQPGSESSGSCERRPVVDTVPW